MTSPSTAPPRPPKTPSAQVVDHRSGPASQTVADRTDVPPAELRASLVWVVVTFVVVALVISIDLLERIPALAPISTQPFYAYVYEIHDLVALVVMFVAANYFSRRIVFALTGWFFLLHIPEVIWFTLDNIPELVRTFSLLTGLLIGVRLILQRRQVQAGLAHMALRDSLTGLANTRQFYADLERFLGEARRYETTGAVLFLDLDRFKSINDIYGHRAGDEYLRSFAGWLRGCLRGTDWVARFGGDEFAAILTHVDPAGAAVVAERIRATADLQEARHDGRRLRSTVSIGIARIPFDGMTFDEVLNRADAAMYRAKARGGNRAEFYSD